MCLILNWFEVEQKKRLLWYVNKFTFFYCSHQQEEFKTQTFFLHFTCYFIQIGRPSIIGSDLGSIAPPTDQASLQEKSQVSDHEFPLQEEEEAPHIPFDTESPQPHEQDMSLISTTPDAKRSSLAIGGLDVVLDHEEEEKSAVKPRPSGTKRKRRRRRIEIDNERTELTSEHIKAMLRNTSDIVRQNRVHPADYVLPEEEEEGGGGRLDEMELRPWKRPRGPYHEQVSSLSYETLIGRPNIADNGALAPELLALWQRNASRLRGEALPFRMRGESGEEQIAELAEEKMEDAAEKGEDIELARRQEQEEEEKDDTRLSTDIPEQEIMQEEEDFPTHFEEEDMPQPMDEEEEEKFAQEQEGGIGFAEDMIAMQSPARSVDSQRSSFSLGAVNDLEKEITGERQEQGEELASSDSKWHKHTVRVLGMLKKNMTTDTGHETLPNNLSYDKLSYGVSRRTACGVFFELLQLKTWDFIELSQEESYSDITVSPGVRFNESPPTE